jgi:L-amino acid N-acyltransferase YncA
MNIRRATIDDANAIGEIYNWYIINTIITFETGIVTVETMRNRIGEKLTTYDWLIAEVDDKIIGYAYYGSFRPRAAYKHTVESTIYLSKDAQGKGFGRLLYARLIESVKERGFREVIGIIALPNPESIRLHEKMGFAEIGILKNIGHKFDNYIDVGIWQKTIIMQKQ